MIKTLTRHTYWTRPDHEPDGFKCKCGMNFQGAGDLYDHVLKRHNKEVGIGSISRIEFERYCKHRGIT